VKLKKKRAKKGREKLSRFFSLLLPLNKAALVQHILTLNLRVSPENIA